MVASWVFLAMGAGQALAFERLEGSDVVQEANVGNTACYASDMYMAVESDSDADIENPRIFLRVPDLDLETQCTQKSGKEVYAVEKEEPCYFSGFLGDVLFLDCGCCPDPRELVVVDLSRKAELLDAAYMSEAEGYFRVEDASKLLWMAYLENPSPKPECQEAAEWEKQGFSVLYQQPMSLDLKTGEVTLAGPVFCAMGQ